jgi:hypothetical protein
MSVVDQVGHSRRARRQTFKELSAKGVPFPQEPAERPYGIETVLRDDSGNLISLVQRLEAAG